MSTGVRNKTTYDVVVIGGGTGGLSATLEAARRNASVLLVQEGRLGGDCTFTGCVASKALLAAAARGQSFKDAAAEVHRAIETVAAAEDDDALGAEGVEVLHGRAVFRSPQEVDVDGRRVRSSRFVVASGAAPLVPPIEGLSEIHPLTNENLFDLDELPPRLAVLGGGPIGAEMSQAFARLGSCVTLLEAGDRILAKEEPEASQVVAETLRFDGVRVRTGSKVVRAEATEGGSGIRVHVDGAEPVEVDQVLVAIGRRPSTSGMGLEDVGVELDDRGFIRTDDTMATSVPGIWAVGDVAGSLQFTHAANRMAHRGREQRPLPLVEGPQAALRHPAPSLGDLHLPGGRPGRDDRGRGCRPRRPGRVPADDQGRPCRRRRRDPGLHQADGRPAPSPEGSRRGPPPRRDGSGHRGRRVGARGGIGQRTNMFTGRLAQTVHAYPTWSLAVQQAAAQFFFEIGGREARPARR